jgi:hypothetical protein
MDRINHLIILIIYGSLSLSLIKQGEMPWVLRNTRRT